MSRSVEMVDGRSWFYEPKPPEAVADKTPVPKKYSGPQLTHIINGTAYFADGQKISPSEPKSKTLELVKSNAPWSITVKWEGGTFDVDLFKRVDLISLKDGGGFTSSYPASTPSFGSRPPDASTATNLSGRPMSDRGDHPPEARIGPGVAPASSPPADAPAPASGAPISPQPGSTPGVGPAMSPTTPPPPTPGEPPQPAPASPPQTTEGRIIISKPFLTPPAQTEPDKPATP
jgi:hypothetical protein